MIACVFTLLLPFYIEIITKPKLYRPEYPRLKSQDNFFSIAAWMDGWMKKASGPGSQQPDCLKVLTQSYSGRKACCVAVDSLF